MTGNLFRKKSVEKILADAKNENIESEYGTLNKTLRVRDLTAFGIAAIIGAGIFSTIGRASADGGPAVVFLFIFTALACGFAAYAYAEFASMVPVSGSAYTYSYVAFGELVAWIIGWALLMEYAIGNVTVAVSWSGYFTSLLEITKIPWLGFPNGIHLPEWLTVDYSSASSGFVAASESIQNGTVVNDLNTALKECYLAWTTAPSFAGLKIILDLPAILVTVFITWVVYIGIKESRNFSNTMVAIKLLVIFLVIIIGAFYVDARNWDPFLPNGVAGVLQGVSAVFFAYIGFDAISTTAEECENPQRDLPLGMMWAIIICTILYAIIALILTGMVKYDELGVNDPLAFVFQKIGLTWFSGIIAVSAVVAMTSVQLVFQLGQPRIWMSMSRDGLLPKKFATIHPKYKTPSFSTIVTGIMVIVPTLFISADTILDLCSMGTLFAFVLVCGGVLVLENKKDIPRGKFKTPYFNSRYFAPPLLIVSFILLWKFNNEGFMDFIQTKSGEESGLKILIENIPMWIFFIVAISLAIIAAVKKLSLIPLCGLVSCLYMMAQIGHKAWYGFFVWLLIGLTIYFTFSFKNSKLNTAK